MSRIVRVPRLGALSLALALAIQVAATMPGQADEGWHGRYGYDYRGHGHRHAPRHRQHGHYHGGGDAAAAVAVVLGGVLIATLLAHSLAEPQPEAPPLAEPLRLGDCKPTTGRRLIDGRWALLRGTWCSDQYGRGYILNDSVRFVRYLD